MSVVTGQSWSSAPLPEVFRFSPRPNQAHRIHWRYWGEEAFQEAIHLDKPIFLLITSSWCQWCHIMDETTLSEPSIIAILNQDYIPIRVDSDLRPDVNQHYNQNGWPSVALLSSEGEILWGGVYVPPKQMLYYLGHIRRYYSEHREEIAEQVRALKDHRITRVLTRTLSSSSSYPVADEELRVAFEKLLFEATRVLHDLYDADYGGFIIHPHLKFPHTEALELLIHVSQHQQSDALTMVCYTLEQMCDGGLWDKEEGGFFRYSAASDWSTPHTEKMLEENAAMLRLLLLTAQATRKQEWYNLARRLILYINTTLWRTDAEIFSGSQSADEDYYEPGPYSRASQEPPHIDTTVYTSWNARMISSYLLAAQVLQAPELGKEALRALRYLCDHMRHQDGSMYHYELDKRPALPGQLADQVWMTRALLDAYDYSGNKQYLDVATDLMHFAFLTLLGKDNRLFYDYPFDEHAVGHLTIREQPLIENAIAAECLLRMATYSKHAHLSRTGLQVLSGCLEKYYRSGIQGSTYACVVAQALANHWL